jgi:hypothetical protein
MPDDISCHQGVIVINRLMSCSRKDQYSSTEEISEGKKSTSDNSKMYYNLSRGQY